MTATGKQPTRASPLPDLTLLTAEPAASALTALKAGQCSASCLLGETARCGCRCGGSHHGILLNVLTARPRPAQDPAGQSTGNSGKEATHDEGSKRAPAELDRPTRPDAARAKRAAVR